jgi:hypothetical protein
LAVKHEAVIRRKTEAIAAVTKRLRDSLQKQQDVAAIRNKAGRGGASAGGAARATAGRPEQSKHTLDEWLEHELEVQFSVQEGQRVLEVLLSERRHLVHQLHLLGDGNGGDASSNAEDMELSSKDSDGSLKSSLQQQVQEKSAEIAQLQRTMAGVETGAGGSGSGSTGVWAVHSRRPAEAAHLLKRLFGLLLRARADNADAEKLRAEVIRQKGLAQSAREESMRERQESEEKALMLLQCIPDDDPLDNGGSNSGSVTKAVLIQEHLEDTVKEVQALRADNGALRLKLQATPASAVTVPVVSAPAPTAPKPQSKGQQQKRKAPVVVQSDSEESEFSESDEFYEDESDSDYEESPRKKKQKQQQEREEQKQKQQKKLNQSADEESPDSAGVASKRSSKGNAARLQNEIISLLEDDGNEEVRDKAFYSAKTVNDLKGFLKDRGLKVSGKKDELIERLLLGPAPVPAVKVAPKIAASEEVAPQPMPVLAAAQKPPPPVAQKPEQDAPASAAPALENAALPTSVAVRRRKSKDTSEDPVDTSDSGSKENMQTKPKLGLSKPAERVCGSQAKPAASAASSFNLAATMAAVQQAQTAASMAKTSMRPGSTSERDEKRAAAASKAQRSASLSMSKPAERVSGSDVQKVAAQVQRTSFLSKPASRVDGSQTHRAAAATQAQRSASLAKPASSGSSFKVHVDSSSKEKQFQGGTKRKALGNITNSSTSGSTSSSSVAKKPALQSRALPAFR